MSAENMHLVRDGMVYLVALILSICVHEFGHAWVADLFGDPLPRSQGRVTLNPLAHIDPVGTLLLPLVAFVLSIHSPAVGSRILGWGKPVQVSLSARHMSRKLSMRTMDILISVAGPAMNVLFALILSGVYVGLLRFGGPSAWEFAAPVGNIVAMNLGLCVFNLIPLPPLDGGHVAVNLSSKPVGDFLGRYGSGILFVLLMAGLLKYVTYPARVMAGWWLEHLAAWAL